jgi:prepilin-type N-terminal cleavage/methylation domain-containing protein
MKDLALRLRARARAAETECEHAAEAGFTLVELMVVLLIVAILLSVAIPAFLGLTETAGNGGAQANLANALIEGKALHDVTGAYANASGTAYGSTKFNSQAPEFQWNYNSACPTTVGNCISALVFSVASTTGTGDNQGLSLAVDSAKTNTCWYIFDLEAVPGITTVEVNFPGAGVFYGKSPAKGGHKGVPTGGCQALNPATDTKIDIGSGEGQSFSSAVGMY